MKFKSLLFLAAIVSVGNVWSFDKNLDKVYQGGATPNLAAFVDLEGGTGTEDDPYLVASASQLQDLRSYLRPNKKTCVRLTADIDMSALSWTPLNALSPYNKVIDFDGANHTIAGLRCTGKQLTSFFGVLNGSIRNVRFTDAQVQNTSSSSHIGIVASVIGTDTAPGTVENVWVEGTVDNKSASAFAGGLVGHLKNGRVENCFVSCRVTSAASGDLGTGGICGYEYDGKNLQSATADVNAVIRNCYFRGSVSCPKASVGGILGKGENRYGNYVQSCIADADSLRGTGNCVGLVAGWIPDQAISRHLFTDNYGSHGTVTYYGRPFNPVTTNASPFDENTPLAYDEPTDVLLHTPLWKVTQLDEGCTWYNFESSDLYVSKAPQVVNVLSADMTSGRYRLDFAFEKSDSLSAFVKRRRDAGIEVLGGVNANYELESIYVRANGENKVSVNLQPSDVRWWKQEGAILGYRNGDVRIRLSDRQDPNQALKNYDRSTATQILSSAPMLIEDYENIGSSFVDKERCETQLNSLDYEDKDRHQGVRHPRTAVAMTGDGHLLLITVDGRATKASGMTADELSRFLVRNFNPRYALNLDGGGSTTMVIPGYGQEQTNVVNYPTDNGKFDHWGQRKREYHLIIERCTDPYAFFPVPNELGQESNSHHGQILFGEASHAAQDMGWPEQMWDLSGATPRLRSFPDTDAVNAPSASPAASACFDLQGKRVTDRYYGVIVQNGKKRFKH